MKAVVTALVLGLALAAPAHAQTAVTLDQAVAEAVKNEPGLRAARAEIEVARGEQAQASLRPNPEISFEQREQTGGSDRQTSIGLEWPLDLFRRDARIESAERASARSDALVRDRERLLAAAVRERYGEALTSARRLDVIDAVVAAARQTLELLANRAAEGAAPPLERDLALVEVRRLEADRALEAGRQAVALRRLNVVMGRAPESPIALADSLDRLALPVPGREAASTERADVQAAAADLDVARAQLRLADQGGKPELRLFGSYMRMDAGFPQSGFTPAGTIEPVHGVFHNLALGVRVSLPVFDRGQGTAAAARARETAAAETLIGRRLEVAGDTAAASARLTAAREALAAYGNDIRSLARRNVDVVRESYTLGRATLLDVLNEQRRYLDFEASYIGALGEAFAAETELQRAKGDLQ